MAYLANEIVTLYAYAAVVFLAVAGIAGLAFAGGKIAWFVIGNLMDMLCAYFRMGKEFLYYLRHRDRIKPAVKYYTALEKDLRRVINERENQKKTASGKI